MIINQIAMNLAYEYYLATKKEDDPESNMQHIWDHIYDEQSRCVFLMQACWVFQHIRSSKKPNETVVIK